MKTDKVYLVGFMGAGKTTAGKRLAALLGWDFIDNDALTEERAGNPISEIFRLYGQTHFRQLERGALMSELERRRVVIATGGGAFPQSAANRHLMRSDGFVVWLDVPLGVIRARLHGSEDTRPLMRDLEAMTRLYDLRRSFYKEAHEKVQAARPPEAVAQAVRQKWHMHL
jgi:shikimate kinase